MGSLSALRRLSPEDQAGALAFHRLRNREQREALEK